MNDTIGVIGLGTMGIGIAGHLLDEGCTVKGYDINPERLRILAEKGGIMGLNFCVSFVREVWNPGEQGAAMEELIRQMKYIVNIGGEECLGLGSDFDGIGEMPQMGNGAGMPDLAEAMEQAKMPYDLIEKICWKNVKRFLKENL